MQNRLLNGNRAHIFIGVLIYAMSLRHTPTSVQQNNNNIAVAE